MRPASDLIRLTARFNPWWGDGNAGAHRPHLFNVFDAVSQAASGAERITDIPLRFIDIGDLLPRGRAVLHEELAMGFDEQSVDILLELFTWNLVLKMSGSREPRE